MVGEKSGMPGLGFIAAADIPQKQQDVFKYDWVAHGGPSAEVLEKAVKDRPSNGIIQIPDE